MNLLAYKYFMRLKADLVKARYMGLDRYPALKKKFSRGCLTNSSIVK